MEVNPLSVILVKSDSKGDRLLFRYPFNQTEHDAPSNTKHKNPYSLADTEDLLQSPPPPISNIHKGQLTGFKDEVLSTLFAVKPELCNRKFELKVNDVRFVGHPTLLSSRANEQGETSLLLINIVFALQALASHAVGKDNVKNMLYENHGRSFFLVKCYYDLSKMLGITLRHEEKRCGYVFEQTQLMTATHDDGCDNTFQIILEKTSLARNLKDAYDNLCTTGKSSYLMVLQTSDSEVGT